jgi:hypothetical protein
MQSVDLTDETKDTWLVEKGNGQYKPSLIYRLHFGSVLNHTPSVWLWKSKCTSKHKFFAWLILHDRINTKDMLLRRHWNVRIIIVVCCAIMIHMRIGGIYSLTACIAHAYGITCKYLGSREILWQHSLWLGELTRGHVSWKL